MTQTFRAAALLAVLFDASSAVAQPMVIGADQGAVFDGIVDGFPMLAVLDGKPNVPGNALAVALQAGGTEERGVGEFPLAGLGDAGPDDVRSAVLTFNIDDVLTTFGPGTGFSGNACKEILVYLYAGDGAVQLDDFSRVDERGAHMVDTQPFGRINDASLHTSGPLVFEVNVTDDVRALLAAAPAAIGVVWRTMDSPTGTSIDNLGDGSAGPPGVNGSAMPFLTFELGADPSATPTVTPSPTPTATAIAPSPTATVPDSPTPVGATPTSPPDGTPSPTASTACAGDCNGDDVVGVSEVITGVNMALGNPGACAALDADGDGHVTVSELVRAVGALLNGC